MLYVNRYFANNNLELLQVAFPITIYVVFPFKYISSNIYPSSSQYSIDFYNTREKMQQKILCF